MNILYISSSIIPSRTANSIHVMKMCQAFARNGLNVTLVAPNNTTDAEKDVVDIFDYYAVEKIFLLKRKPWLWIYGRGYLYSLFAAFEAIRCKADIVFCRNLAGCYFSALLGKNVIFESHAPVAETGRLNEFIFTRLVKRNELIKVVVITESLAKYYRDRYPFLNFKIQVAPDGADPAPEDIKAVELGGARNRLKVGYIGHLYQGRGIDVILNIASLCQDIDFYFVGGSERDIHYWKLEAGDLKNIYFLGFVSPGCVPEYRKAFDIVLAPYQKTVSVSGSGDTASWMSPLKAFEYMASRKAIIVSDLPVLNEIFIHEENALLCRPDIVEDWISALDRLQNDLSLREKIAKNAYEQFNKYFTWSIRAKNVLS